MQQVQWARGDLKAAKKQLSTVTMQCHLMEVSKNTSTECQPGCCPVWAQFWFCWGGCACWFTRIARAKPDWWEARPPTYNTG